MAIEAKPTDWEQDCLRWRGRVLRGKYAHWCYDWDFLPVDETTDEMESCACGKEWLDVHDYERNE